MRVTLAIRLLFKTKQFFFFYCGHNTLITMSVWLATSNQRGVAAAAGIKQKGFFLPAFLSFGFSARLWMYWFYRVMCAFFFLKICIHLCLLTNFLPEILFRSKNLLERFFEENFLCWQRGARLFFCDFLFIITFGEESRRNVEKNGNIYRTTFSVNICIIFAYFHF